MKQIFLMLLLLSLCFQVQGRGKKHSFPKPFKADVAYGEHERNKLDFWKADSAGATPVVVFFHGGAFKAGDKSSIHLFMEVEKYMSKGISCITVNYPFLKHTNNNYLAIMKHCEQSIEFIKKNSKEWNIEMSKIAVSGCSAGCLISQWLGYRTKNISAMAVFLQPMGTDFFVTPAVKKGAPPLFIYQTSPFSDKIHHPDYATNLKKVCDQKKAPCELWGSGTNGIKKLPKGQTPKEVILKFFQKSWE